MYEKKRSVKWPVIVLFILAALVLSACGTTVENNSWPGLTADGDVVYVAYGPGVLAIDVVEREQIWSFPAESNQTLQFYANPSINDGRVVLGDYGAAGGFFSPNVVVGIYSLDQDGNNLDTNWIQENVAHDRIVAAPVQDEGLVYVGTADNQVLALDSETGELAWQFEVKHSIWSAPVYEDGILYVGSLDKSIYALDAQTGDLIWEQPLSGSVSGAIAIGENLLYIGSFDKQLHALDKATGNVQWEVPAEGTADWIWASPALVGDIVVFSDKEGNVFAVDAMTGESIWETQVNGDVVASPVIANGIVFVASAGQLNNDDVRRGALIALDVETGEELWRKETPAPIYTTPVFVDDTVVLALPTGAEELLIVFNQEDGDEIWRYSLPVEG